MISRSIDNRCTFTNDINVIFNTNKPGKIVIDLPINPQAFFSSLSLFLNSREGNSLLIDEKTNQTQLLNITKHLMGNLKSAMEECNVMVRDAYKTQFFPVVNADSYVISSDSKQKIR